MVIPSLRSGYPLTFAIFAEDEPGDPSRSATSKKFNQQQWGCQHLIYVIKRIKACARNRNKAMMAGWGNPGEPFHKEARMSVCRKLRHHGLRPRAGRATRKPARGWIAHDRKFGHFIDGAWYAPADGKCFETADPRPAKCSQKLPRAARLTSTPPSKRRARPSPAWGELAATSAPLPLRAGPPDAATLPALRGPRSARQRQAHPRDARHRIPLVARHFYHHAGWAQLLETEFPGYHRVGVVGQIIPWNFPLLMLAWKIAPALAAGKHRWC